ncbi:hypothetical protein MPDQ_006986 [Monascus purpureus]|uniref:Uncharacterized protein n=1 Tax=Monascus purpureus TaxID=5098 RepID=A0A507QWN4_MONPU|nr:hypothetical protein MPDQ_006986 [Monascus purpureus]
MQLIIHRVEDAGLHRICSCSPSVFVLNPLIPVVLGLRTTVGSPCTDVCHQTSNETTPADIVCLDSDYNTTITGSNFQKCVECQLRSSYADNYTGETDVLWGLYNLRYAFSTCVFGYPKQVNNISSPCIVACQPLDAALEPGLTTATSDYYSMCLPDVFPDNIVTTCEFCYNLTTNQVYMANFIEALRYNCHFRTSLTDAFAISPTKIFYPSGLPPSVPTSSAASGSSGHRNLTVIIVLPVLAGVILISVALGAPSSSLGPCPHPLPRPPDGGRSGFSRVNRLRVWHVRSKIRIRRPSADPRVFQTR